MKKVHAAVVGTGFIGPVHVEALRRIGVEVVGLLGSSPDRAREKADAMGVARVYESFEQILTDPDVDVVHITSPNYLHFEQAKATLLAGKHVVCEKPLAMDTKQSTELVEVANRSGLVAAVNFNVRYYPLVHEAKARVRADETGRLVAVHGSYLQDWLLYDTDWNWRLEQQFSGKMRAVADIGSHWLDLITFITDLRVESVIADFHTMHPIRQKPTRSVETFTGTNNPPAAATDQMVDTEDFASILLRFVGGARGALTVSQVSAGRKNRLWFEIDGTKESLAWDAERPNELWIGHRDRPNELLIKDPSLMAPDAARIASYPGGHTEGFPDTFKQLYRDVYDSITNPAAPRRYPNFEDGHYELALGEAIFLSANENRWVQLSEILEIQR